ncbi:MAG: zinc-ribbon domain-containing protein [Spirochaetaceae bacterium]|nr:zinc-ribbon domain-containing protein [Spirochaetaceae bacterium]
MFCSNCGKELEAGDLFCGYCGARQEPAAGNEGPAVGDAAQGTQAGPAAPVPGKRSPVVPIVIAVLLVAGAGAGFMLWRNSGVSFSAPKSTVARSTSVTAPAGLRVVTGDGAEWGVHSMKWYYDSAGNIPRVEHYGADGRLTLNSNGVAIYESEYDRAGNMTRLENYGVDGRLTLNSYGWAILEIEYTSVVKTRTYDVQGRRVY